MQAIWIKVIKTKDWTPKEPILLSFIAFKSFFLPAKIPSKVSIKPSRCKPPVIKYPEAKEINADEYMDHELVFKKIKIQLCIIPIKNPIGGANCAIFLNSGLTKGIFGNVV